MLISFVCVYICGHIWLTASLSLLCLREHCRSSWTICSLRSSAPVDLYLWLSSTFSTCWMSRLCSTTSRTPRPSTSGRPTGKWPAAAAHKWFGCLETGLEGRKVGLLYGKSGISSKGLRTSCVSTACPHRTYGQQLYYDLMLGYIWNAREWCRCIVLIVIDHSVNVVFQRLNANTYGLKQII